MAKLTAEQRDALPASSFAVPGKRALPIHDETHARLAWSMVERTEGLSEEERATARARILRALKKFGVDTSEYAKEVHDLPLGSGVVRVLESPPASASSSPSAAPVRDVLVTVIQEGTASSGRHYTLPSLRDIGRQLEGLRAFADHPTTVEDQIRPARSIRDIVGFYQDAEVIEGAPGTPARVDATLHVLESAGWLWQLLQESVSLGRPDLVGVSIDALVHQRPRGNGDPEGCAHVVESVPVLKSGDIVTRASAGGAIRSVVEGADLDLDLDLDLELGADVVDREEEIEPVSAPAIAAVASPVPVPLPLPAPAPAPAPAQEQDSAGALRLELVSVREEVELLRRERLILTSSRVLEERLAPLSLPAPIKDKLRRRFEGQVFESASLDAALADEVEAIKRLRELGLLSGLVTDHGEGRASVGNAPARQRDILQQAWDRFFGVKEALDAPSVLHGAAVPRWLSLREAYVQTTGDPYISGVVRPELSIAREVNEVTTTILNEVVMHSLTKRLIQDYMGQPQDWRRFCDITSLVDFKRQDRIALQDFSALSTVAEGGAYTNLAWGDTRENYTPAKRGNLVVVTREAILNDDIRAVRQIPSKLAISAGITINEFVYTTLITTNPTMSDGAKVYDDGVQTSHGNRGTTALASAALTAAIASMLKQTNSSGKRVGVRPRFLLLPPDLWATSNVLVGSTLVPGSANNDVNVLRGLLEPIIVPQFTDVSDYYLFTDPALMPTIEIGFVQGKEVPELLLQDAPMDGAVFTNDQISYKVRWEFGGGFLDYRGTFWGNVA